MVSIVVGPTIILVVFTYIVSGLGYVNCDFFNTLEGFFTASFILNTQNKPSIVEGVWGDYIVCKGNSGDRSIDVCPASEYDNGEHKMAESSPANLSSSDPSTADCASCDKEIQNSTDHYNTCIGCDSSFCNSCFTKVFMDTSGEENVNNLLFLVTIDAPIMTIILTLRRLHKQGFFYWVSFLCVFFL